MLLAIDIGNSSIKFGIFDGPTLSQKFSIPTARTPELADAAAEAFSQNLKDLTSINQVYVSSVVPEAEKFLAEACIDAFSVDPVFIDHRFDVGLMIAYEPPSAVGIDRVINAAAAAAIHGRPVIACSFGTATTFDVADREGTYIGGAIAPGMRLLAESLNTGTSKLPLVDIAQPDRAIAVSTEGSIRSGIFYGYIGMIEGILQSFFEELGERPTVVGTGGFASLVASECTALDVVDEDLTLKGIRMIAERGGS